MKKAKKIYETLLLVVTATAFAGSIWAVISNQYRLITLVCFAVHAIAALLLMLALLGDQKTADDGITDLNDRPTVDWMELKESLEREKGKLAIELESVRTQLGDLLHENETLRLESDDSRRKADVLNSRLMAELKAKAQKDEETLAAPSVDMSILPPVTGGKETVNIAEIAKEAANELSESAAKAGVEVRFNPTTEDLLVKAEPDRIRILFRNIIDNSIKYMGNEGSLVITISALEDMIFIILKDNGLGLPSDQVQHIFELNYQGSNRISGNGLGLTQAKAIVEYYGGNIYAKSTEHGGMGIYIQLPAN